MAKGPDIIRMELDVDSLVPDPENPNEMDAKEFEMLVETIKEVGFLDPVTVAELSNGDYAIIGGEHRAKAARVLGMKTIPCDVVQGEKWESADLRHFQNVRLNVIHGKLNPEKMLAMYNKMASKYGDKAIKLLGFASDTGLMKILKDVKSEMKASLPPEMAKEFEEKAKNARTVNDLEKIIRHLFEAHGDTMHYNFMVFSWGGKEHIYISLDKDVHDSMKKIMNKAKKDKININDLLGAAINDIANSITDK
jgi:ParB/RepB/Spo0J family partition protein